MEQEPTDDSQSDKGTPDDEIERKRLLEKAAKELAQKIGGSVLENNPGLGEKQ